MNDFFFLKVSDSVGGYKDQVGIVIRNTWCWNKGIPKSIEENRC